MPGSSLGSRCVSSVSSTLPPGAADSLFGEAVQLPSIDAQSLVSHADAAQLEEDGAIVLRDAFPNVWVQTLRAAAERNLSNPGPLCDEHARAQGSGGRFHDDQFLWRRHPEFEAYVRRSGAAQIAARAMGSRSANILYDQLFVKEPGTSAPTPWHNDTSYWPLEGKQICSIWLALDMVPAGRGLCYVRGSHKWQLRHAITNFSGGDHSAKNVYGGAASLEPVPDIDAGAARGEYELLRWDMEPGDILIFYSATMHGGPGNSSSKGQRRRGYATRWCGDDVVFVERAGTMNDGWKAAGFDSGLKPGQSITCDLHPNILAPSS